MREVYWEVASTEGRVLSRASTEGRAPRGSLY